MSEVGGADQMHSELAHVARHWAQQTDKRKGIRLSAEQVDLLNEIGVGRLIAEALGELQQQQAKERRASRVPDQS